MSSLGLPGKGITSFLTEHLATFIIQSGGLTAQEGLKKLQQIEKSGGIWTLKVRINVYPPYLNVTDEMTGKLIEKFSLKSMRDIQSINVGGAYNNLLLFTVMDSQIPELHIFRCIDKSADEIISTMEVGKNERVSPGIIYSRQSPVPISDFPFNLIMSSNDISKGRQMLRKSLKFPTIPPPEKLYQISDPTDRNVKLLDCLFSDIEIFVTKLQKVAEALNNLKNRTTLRGGGGHGDGLVSLRCKLPPGKDFIDILQKFKLSFILIEKLKHRINNPNAPELIHFLFKPLSFVVKVIAGANFENMELVNSIDNPLITEEVKYMFDNCLVSAENDVWKRLGKAWISTREEWHEKLPTYKPVFQDGWSPPLDWMREIFPDDGQYGIVNIPSNNNKGFKDQDEFLKDIQLRNAKIAIVRENQMAANSKELSVTAGDVLEVLDDTKKWWKTRNYKDEIGFVSRKVLQLG